MELVGMEWRLEGMSVSGVGCECKADRILCKRNQHFGIYKITYITYEC